MFYNLFVPLTSEWTVLNVFRYISFRSLAALITALVLSIFIGPRFIAWLRSLKCGQYIHEDVAAHACKAGTPTMGGLLMLFTLTVSLLLWSDLTNPYIWQAFFVFAGFAACPPPVLPNSQGQTCGQPVACMGKACASARHAKGCVALPQFQAVPVGGAPWSPYWAASTQKSRSYPLSDCTACMRCAGVMALCMRAKASQPSSTRRCA